MSLDGYIAKPDGDIDFLSLVSTPNEDFGFSEFLEGVDTVIWGRKTFDKVLSFGKGVPYKNKQVFVMSRQRTGRAGHAHYHSDVVELVRSLKVQPGKDIYCDGGGEIVFELLRNRLIDKMIINVIPHLLGDGIRLFRDGNVEQQLHVVQAKQFSSGLVQVWYELI
jgi:dihydrofolate reductase